MNGSLLSTVLAASLIAAPMALAAPAPLAQSDTVPAALAAEPANGVRYAFAGSAPRVVTMAPLTPNLNATGGGDQYFFAMTRSLNRTDAHPVLKLTILPFAVVVDILFAPIALIADLFT